MSLLFPATMDPKGLYDTFQQWSRSMPAEIRFTIRAMEETDLPFMSHPGLCETNWQDIPSDQRTLLKREEWSPAHDG